ncbi:MAG: hypothetical protein U0893_09055 [Chloroflexota bacterium]
MQDDSLEPDEIRRLVHELGEAGGARIASSVEVARLRDFFGRRVLRQYPDAYIQRKYDQHVVERQEWPDDTTPEDYLESLRETVLDAHSSIYLAVHDDESDWSIYFVGSVRRSWRGRRGADHLFVAFNAQQHFLITGFQPPDGDRYVERQGGFWVRER